MRGRRTVIALTHVRSALTAGLILYGAAAQAGEMEKPPPGEADAIKTIVSLALKALAERYPEGAPLVRRDAHAKQHGCVRATFEVGNNVPAQLRVGLLAKPGEIFKSWIRFSNGAFEPGADTGMDGRGMALKILYEQVPAGARTSHDILMINHPVFFSPDAIDYLDFARAGALTGNSEGLKRYFLPSYAPWTWRVRQGLIAYRIASKKIQSPLLTQYFSMVPYEFGAGKAVKYSARPCSADARDSLADKDKNDANFLRIAMREHLRHAPACFHFLLQERGPDMSIEDATSEWSESAASYVEVGTIRIPEQQFDIPETDKFCESLTFNPWNAPAEHQPLGSINRVRKSLYEAISAYRSARNKVDKTDPLQFWSMTR
jgi:hypothetical protein